MTAKKEAEENTEQKTVHTPPAFRGRGSDAAPFREPWRRRALEITA
tara:strand:+ start:6317 stop:6454 length:138 start_codon:yes stop_codon:yes gene_type:complete